MNDLATCCSYVAPTGHPQSDSSARVAGDLGQWHRSIRSIPSSVSRPRRWITRISYTGRLKGLMIVIRTANVCRVVCFELIGLCSSGQSSSVTTLRMRRCKCRSRRLSKGIAYTSSYRTLICEQPSCQSRYETPMCVTPRVGRAFAAPLVPSFGVTRDVCDAPRYPRFISCGCSKPSP